MSMLYVVLSLLLITSGAIAQANQGCICTALVDPVCGKDNQNYSNECQAKCAAVEVAYKGSCTSKACICSEDYKPVCGKDGRDYSNRCVAECLGAVVASEGECPLKGCRCKKEYKPVCGTNGRTYSNECFATCDKTGVESEGKCPPMDGTELDPEACVANCPDEDVPVCGSDGKTYTNGCLAVCSNAVVVRAGECDPKDQSLALSLPVPSCICTLEYFPVCGSNNVTYGNPCLARCAQVDVVNGGDCGFRLQQQPQLPAASCICTMEFRPVCGSDNATYDNPCLARCAKVDIVNEGLCGAASPGLPLLSGPGCGTQMCPAVFAPVCDTEGQTHSNECVAKCSGAEVAHLGPCVDLSRTCECPRELATVCGADGLTYPNECLAICNKTLVASVGPCLEGNASSPSSGRLVATVDNSTVAGTSLDCTASCSTDSKPVCGKDDKTYLNKCVATCSGTDVAQEGPCAAPLCGFGACAKSGFTPVCGKDKKTYPNECQAKCAGTEVDADGNCDRCLCTMEYKPVCGEDGITYPNSCEAKCLGMSATTPGKCTQGCICTDEYKPVCGINGNTYSNECEAKCADMGVSYEGPCETEHIPDTLCECSKELFPVCGKDGITYDNKCLVKCANTTVAYEGMCNKLQASSISEGSDLPVGPAVDAINDVQFGPQSLKTDPPSCICTREYMPVCGKNSKTYANKCLAKCAGTQVAYKGTCACKCTKEFRPVCATDGRTYSNPCQAQCKGEKAAYEGVCKRGEPGAIPCGPGNSSTRCSVDPCKGKKCAGAVCMSFSCAKPVLYQGAELKEACTAVFVTRKAGVLVRGRCA